MPKFIITWDAGFGESAEIIEAETLAMAKDQAYDAWKEAAENEAHYAAEEYSKERADELGL